MPVLVTPLKQKMTRFYARERHQEMVWTLSPQTDYTL